jgi:hypothetical protein
VSASQELSFVNCKMSEALYAALTAGWLVHAFDAAAALLLAPAAACDPLLSAEFAYKAASHYKRPLGPSRSQLIPDLHLRIGNTTGACQFIRQCVNWAAMIAQEPAGDLPTRMRPDSSSEGLTNGKAQQRSCRSRLCCCSSSSGRSRLCMACCGVPAVVASLSSCCSC